MDTNPEQMQQVPTADRRLAISIAEAAELLSISRAFGYELAARGVLPTLRLGRRLVVPRVALLALVGVPPSAAE
jgi:excisionase family DNA binding protein